jgi:hypothetical protein
MPAARAAGAGARLFPAPGAKSAWARGRDQECANRLLHFVDRRFTFAQRVFGWNLDPETRLGRVLLLRRQAFEAERAANFRTADFHWVEAHRALKRAAADPGVWRHVLGISAFSPAVTPEILRERVIQELFIDLHQALFESQCAAGAAAGPDDRRFVHCTYVERLVDLAGFGADRAAATLRPMVDVWLGACRDAGDWKRAIALSARLAERFAPDAAYVNELVVCLLHQTIDRLTRPPAPFASGDAGSLLTGIRAVERAAERHGPTGFLMAALARLHSMRAVALANTGACAEALVEISMALDHGGHDPECGRMLRELTALMESMRGKAATLRGAVDSAAPPEPFTLVAEAEKGFGPMQAYRSSERAGRTRRTALAADAIDLWRHIGLPRPEADWPTRALALGRALATVIRHPPAAEAGLASAWAAAAAGDDLVTGVPVDPPRAFLARRLFDPRHAAQWRPRTFPPRAVPRAREPFAVS